MKRRTIFADIPLLGICIVIASLILAAMMYKIMKSSSAPVILDAHEVETDVDLLAREWQFMPGVTRNERGLVVHPLGLSLVEQNGVFAQMRSPINLAGVYMNFVTGDMSLRATLEEITNKKATLQLYTKLPIIADEFLVEGESVRMTFENNILAVQTPSITQNFAYTPSDIVNLNITRLGDTLTFNVNDIDIGTISVADLFSTQKIWFGLDSEGGDWRLTKFSAEELNEGDIEVADSATLEVLQHDPQGLQLLASRKRDGFLVGSAVALGPLVSDKDYAQITLDKNMFGSVTAENAMKMINLQPQKGIFNFAEADAIVKLAKQNGQAVHGHTLVFGEANPTWFNGLPVQTLEDKQEIERIMIDHITQVVTHFGKDINSWDVVNEPLADYSRRNTNILRNHKWYQAMGEAYIVKSLEAAYRANPEATLFINEYGLEAGGSRWENFKALLTRVKVELEARNIPTNNLGVGFQSHVYDEYDAINTEELRQHIRELQTLGFKAQISEMDVYSDDGDQVQSDQYANVFNVCLSESNCVAWRAWILSDRYNLYKDDDGQIKFGKDGLFSDTMLPRPVVVRMQEVLK